MAAMVHSCGDAIVSATLEGVIRSWNPGAERLYGYAAQEVIGRDLSILAPPGLVDEIPEILARIGRGEHPEDHETVRRRKDGELVHISLRVSPIVNGAGEVVGASAVARDISQRTAEAMQRAQQLRELAIELTQVEQRERQRLAAILHDSLQQLLFAARLHLTRSLRQAQDEALRQALETVQSLLVQSVELSRSLSLEISPPELARVGVVPSLNWLAGWMQEKYALSVALDLAQEANPPEEHMRVLAFEAVRELLFNVVKHAGVQCARVQARRVPGDLVRISVSDEGAGFDPQQQPTAIIAGRVGLSNLRQRLEWLGGRLEIESAPGQGACVTLYVPMPAAAPRAANGA